MCYYPRLAPLTYRRFSTFHHDTRITRGTLCLMYSRPAHPDIRPEPLHVPVIEPAEVAVELRDLGRAFAGTQAIDGLNLRIPGGEFLA